MKNTLQNKTKTDKRRYIPKDFSISDWSSLEPFFKSLLEEQLNSLTKLEAFLFKMDELEAIISEDIAWRYIRMTCDTQNETFTKSYQYFIAEILPHLSSYEDKINRKIVGNPYFNQLSKERYGTYTRALKRQIEMFREENIPLITDQQATAQKYSALIGAMTVEINGQTYTLQQAGKLLEEQDRKLRKQSWEKVQARRLEDKKKINELIDKLIATRTQIAHNAGYESYTQFKFDQLGRFDYTLKDTHTFHDAIEKVLKPVYIQFLKERMAKLGQTELRPWDLQIDIHGDNPLNPFKDSRELIEKTIAILAKLKPELGGMIRTMDKEGFLDLESRIGKAPGGYNYPLSETGIPFIFMNAAGTQSDVTTMLHESGHAVHSFLVQDIRLNSLKHTPSEVAELASMTMELLSLDFYSEFYDNADEEKRAKKEQISRCLMVLSWIAAIDAFQQWLYDNPKHTHEEREKVWVSIYKRFHGDLVNWEGYEESLHNLWQKQGHIFEVPFYYIEYGIAQLGAIAIWRNYQTNPSKGLAQYISALKLGYTETIPVIYEAGGIKFDFSETYVKELVAYCMEQYINL